ncbi:MAG: restriction endonuclease, partial [Chthonomonadales bacterium]
EVRRQESEKRSKDLAEESAKRSKDLADRRQDKNAKIALAASLTQDARKSIAIAENLLAESYSTNHEIDWTCLKDFKPFEVPKPVLMSIPAPTYPFLRSAPVVFSSEFQPKLNFLDKLIPSRKAARVQEAGVKFSIDKRQWEQEKVGVEAAYKVLLDEYGRKMKEVERNHIIETKNWERSKQTFEAHQRAANKAIDDVQAQYESGNVDAIETYCEMVLSRSKNDLEFPQVVNLALDPASSTLLIDYHLPDKACIPSLKEVKYVQSKSEYEKVMLPASTFNSLYDSILYQLVLRALFEVFDADKPNHIPYISLNGWVRSIDNSTGLETNGCILSILVNREEFMGINLSQVDPKTCFKKLKGVGSSKLHSLSPVIPIIASNRDDRRFVSSYEVAKDIDAGTNLAAMSWEDFEHLVRELFEKEFSVNGGEVKVTQASRDGGVDAIAFDPDPIRGGKIVIQAKRYTNIVGVSAVRDLYGTVINEGATKGVLVTTADYGPDSYEFAKGKPITLLNGGHLLHLLQKHGHNARINIQEAKLLGNLEGMP